jgi:choline-sulfatase
VKAFPPLWVCFLAVFPALAQTSANKATAPDIFLVTIDTLRADHVRCYGYADVETPALDALAHDGIRFTQAFTPSPITNTSHTSILTGRMPSAHGVTDFGVPLTATHVIWAELLHQRGYRTAAFIGAVILDSKSLAPGLDRGFDYYDNFPEHAKTKARWGRVERRGMDVVQHAESWLTAHPAGPHFVWLHLYDPHDPYEPPPPYGEKYKDHLYDGEIAYADSALVAWVEYLKKHVVYQNSLIIVVGDHGEGLGEHQEDTHGIFLYDSTTHVPLIVKLPGGSDAGKVVDAQVRTIDLLPTALDFAGAAASEKLDGESLAPFLKGSDSNSRVARGETDYPLRFGWAALRSVRSAGFKLIEAPRPELYDLQKDPGELNNQYAPENPQVKSLHALLPEARTPARALPDAKDRIEEQNLLHLAMMAADDDRLADARRALHKVLQLDAKSPTALRQLGDLELQAGDYAQAAEHLKGAMEARPDDAATAFHAGQALAKSNDPAGARDALQSSLKLMPAQLDARLLLGKLYLELKDGKAAEDQFEAALLTQPHSIDAQLGLAKCQIAENNFAAALRHLEPLSKTGANNTEVWDLLAQAYRALGKTAEAKRAQQQAKFLRQPQ